MGDTFTGGSTTSVGKYGDVTFRAQYTPIDYLITFNPLYNDARGSAVTSNYDSATDTNHYKYNYECRASTLYTVKNSLPASTWLGYSFVGWQPETSVGSWDASQVYPAGTDLHGMHGNVTLNAVWDTETSTVNLNLASDESISGNTSLDYAFSTPLTLNNPTKTGWKFKGWKVTTVPTNYASSVPVDNRWIINTVYSAETVMENGVEVIKKVTLDAGKIGDVTLTPMWEHIEYTVTYAGNNGTTPTADTYYIDSNAFTLPGSTRNGYDFDGWQVTEHDDVYNWTETTYASGYSVTKGHYGNVTLTAQWKPHVYTITLNVAGGDPLTPNTRSYKITESTGLPTPTRTGWKFTGWKVTSPGANTSWGQYTEPFAGANPAAPAGNYGDLTLTAQWEHKTYTIEKSTNGTNGEDVTYHIDDAAFTLGGSVSAGYNFTGWKVTSAEADCWTVGDVIGADYLISNKYGNVVVEAQFDPIGYEITYLDKDGAQIGETQAYNIESDDVMIRTYAKDGYTFDGWEVIADASAPNWNNGSILQPGGPLAANIYYGDVTLKAKLTPIDYTVTFDANGGMPLAALLYNIESAGETDVLPTPTRNGYDFNGWKVTAAAGNWVANATFAAGTAVTGKWGSPTLQAQWTPKKFTITYITGAYPDGITKQGTYNETAPDLTEAEKAKPADAQYTYTFDHWEPSLTTVTGEATYTAVYTKTVNKYTVTWMIPTDTGNQTLGNYTGTVSSGIEYGTVPVYNEGVNPTLTSSAPETYSWRFNGWSLTADGAVLDSIPAVTGNATYYANFTPVLTPEEVHWIINGVDNVELWGVGETPRWEHDTPTKPDANGYRYVFTAWDPTPVPVEDGITYTYTAQFRSELQDYTITLNLNGGATDAALEYPYQMGNTVTFPAPERTGYTFAGWKLDEAVGNWPADTVVPAGEYATGSYWGNVSFTAQWTPVSYRITFNAASEDDVLPEALTYTIESTDVIPAATREGHTLNGWIVSVGGGNWTQGATLAAACQLLKNYGNVTLTPMWQVNTYTITWDSEGYIQTSQAEYGSAILSFTPISKMGYTADWDREVPATMPAQDLTFTAVYTPVQYYIRLNVNGGNPVDNFYYTINGDNTLPTPTRSGATFLGWKVASAQGNWTKNALMAGGASLNGKYGNVSLTAQWELERHTVTWVAGDVTKETVWLYGAVPSYDGTPYKSPDETNSYVFVGWAETADGDTLESLPAVTDDVTYYAQFSKTERKYAVVWNVDGATTTEYYSYGQTPVYPGESDPVRSSTTEYDFTFTGWSPAVGEVTADVTYYAQFDVFTKLQGLSIDVASMFMDIGDDGAVQAQLYPATATVRDVIWTSLNPAVATVDNNGTITAVDAGIALINVSSVDKKFNAYCVVTVAPRHTKYVEITAGGISTTQLAGAMLQLSATIQPDNATDTGIRWSSGDVSVATVDANGLVKYVGVGETDITAIASDGFSMGSIHVVTTTDETEVENEVKTYLVTFGEFYPGFKFTENGEHYTAGRLYVAEGETIRFKLDVQNSRQSGYSVYANTELMSCDADYWYTLDNIQNNMIIRFADSAAGIGTPEEDDGGDSGAKLTFFERLAAFFRKIVEFFRGLFKK